MRVDCLPLNLPGAGTQTESNYSIGAGNDVRVGLQDSARSKASVVREIEKLTKITEAQISAGIQI